MDILLLRPPRPPKTITIGEFMYCEPLGLEAVYGVLRRHHKVLLIDMMAERIDLAALLAHHRPRVVGISSICIDVTMVLQLAEQIKNSAPAIKVVVGGTQAQLSPASFLSPAIDYIMSRTSRAGLEALFAALVAGHTPGQVEGLYQGAGEPGSSRAGRDQEFLPPDRSATSRYRHQYSYLGFRPCALLQTSWGCSKRCAFCLRWRLEGGEEHPRCIPAVCQEIAAIEEEHIMIIDNDFLCDPGRLTALCDCLEAQQVHKNFLCYGSVASVLAHRREIKRFARNGLRAVLVGYESFSDQELASYHKQCTIKDSLEVSRFLRAVGIDVWASFIMHPDWTHGDFTSFRRHIKKLRPEISSLTPLTAFPGTPYYQHYRDRLLIDKTDYSQWSFGEVTIAPKHMSLRAYYFEVLRTNLHINLFLNNGAYLVKRFGWATLFRLSWGGLKLSWCYLQLFWRAQ